ncbi:MAG: DNA polymerase IV [Patescibacteria group bacterium]
MILHLDMDYFFAQVEERENPRFKGEPLVVGADPKKGKARGVVSTCNYEAREYGIGSGMAISKAYEACPEAVYLPVNKKLYSRVSENIFRIMEGVTKKCERVSFDEAYLNLSGVVNNYSQAEKIGKELKELILRQEKLTCSVGIGKNKMVAKMASEMDKPDGLTVIRPQETLRFISNKSIREIPGIGPKTESKIEKLLSKIDLTIKDVRGLSENQLVDELGKRGADIYKKVRGEDQSKVSSETKTKSLGRETTFEENTSDPEKIISTFKDICKKVANLAENEEKKIKTVVAVCRFEGFNTYTRQVSFEPIKVSEEVIYKKGVKLLLKLLAEKAKPVRLLGVRVVFDK